MSIEALAWAFKQTVTPAAKKFVLVAIADNADTYGICWPSYRHLSEKTGLDRRSVMRHCKDLVKDGVIEKAGQIRGDGSDTSNAYRLPIKETITDHPLSFLFKGEGVTDCHPGVTDCHPGVTDRHSGGDGLSLHEPSSNRHLTEKEKKPLSRDEFLREIDRGFNGGSFAEWPHLTETEIVNAAQACLDFYGAKGEWPAGEPVPVLRHWIRGGVKKGTIRKAPCEPKKEGLAGGSAGREPENPLQPWHERIRPLVGDGSFRSWIRPLHWNGNGKLCAPSRFVADHVRNNFRAQIETALPGVEIVHLPYQPQPEKETVNAH